MSPDIAAFARGTLRTRWILAGRNKLGVAAINALQSSGHPYAKTTPKSKTFYDRTVDARGDCNTPADPFIRPPWGQINYGTTKILSVHGSFTLLPDA